MTKDISSDTRFGLHYFPDTLHYRETDLRVWLPELLALGVSWLVLRAPSDRAIPEDFINGLVNAGIEPIIHFPISFEPKPSMDELNTLLAVYARWGVHYVVLFDRPNTRQFWTTEGWSKSELVQNFLDTYLPLAGKMIELGLTPVFPPLEPGGDYWDLSFLRATLENLLQRGETLLLEKLVLGAYASAGERPLEWGMGGQECWPGARPYHTPLEEQDQRGFFIFDWYNTITQAVLGKSLPIILFGVGSPGVNTDIGQETLSVEEHIKRNIILTQWVNGLSTTESLGEIPSEILAGNLWLMATSNDTPSAKQAWYQADGQTLPMVGMLRQAQAMKEKKASQLANNADQEKIAKQSVSSPVNDIGVQLISDIQSSNDGKHPIAHYLLISDKSKADYYINILQPFIKRFYPTVGFSDIEAAFATRVTVVSNGQGISDERIQTLRAAGCKVVCLNGSGTELAHFMAML